MAIELSQRKADKETARRNGYGRTVLSLDYDVRTSIGRLIMDPDSCSCLHGALELFKQIDPDVQRIEVYRPDGACESIYARNGKRWADIGQEPNSSRWIEVPI